MLLYMDDMLIASMDIAEVKRVKQLLTFKFNMKDLGHARKILGMEIARDRSNDELVLTHELFTQNTKEI